MTSFRYYGELLDPELANLQILTAGIGFVSRKKKASLDLIGHYYRQHQPSSELFWTDIDERPNGIDPDLGWEIDAVFGWRNRRRWDLEAVGAYFQPGKAFDDADEVSGEDVCP